MKARHKPTEVEEKGDENMKSNVEDMEKRLASLEKQNRRLKGIGVAVLALVGVALLMGANEPGRIIEAEKFVGKNKNGITRAVIENGSLLLCDEAGQLRAGLTVTKEGPWLMLYDEAGKNRAILAANKERPGLILRDEAGNHIWQAP